MDNDDDFSALEWMRRLLDAVLANKPRELGKLLALGREWGHSAWDYMLELTVPEQHPVLGPLDDLQTILLAKRRWACLKEIILNDKIHGDANGIASLMPHIAKLWESGGSGMANAKVAIRAIASVVLSNDNGWTGIPFFTCPVSAELNREFLLALSAVDCGRLEAMEACAAKKRSALYGALAKGDGGQITTHFVGFMDIAATLARKSGFQGFDEKWMDLSALCCLKVCAYSGYGAATITACARLRSQCQGMFEPSLDGDLAFLVEGLELLDEALSWNSPCISADLMRSMSMVGWGMARGKFEGELLEPLLEAAHGLPEIGEEICRGLNRRAAELEAGELRQDLGIQAIQIPAERQRSRSL